MSETDQKAQKLVGAGALTAAERIIAQFCQFAVFVVAARILGPADFGIYALVSACAILLFRASEGGWAPYIMCWAGDVQVPRRVLTLSIICGVLFGLIGLVASSGISIWGLDTEIVVLVQLFSLWIVLATVSSAQKGMMIWQKSLRSSAVCEILGELAGLAVSLSTLLAGWGILSIVFGRLAYQITHLTISFVVTRTAPGFGFEGKMLADLWVFSQHFFFSRMLSNIRLYVATFIVGGALGPEEVGYYRVAERLVGAVTEVIAVPAQMLGWALFKQARDADTEAPDNDRLRAQLRLFLTLLVAISVPVFVWLMVASDALIETLLKSEWLPAVPLVLLLAVARLLGSFGIAIEPLLSMLDQSKQLPKLSLATLAVTVIATLAAVPFGLYAVAWAQIVAAAVLLGVTVWLFRRFADVGASEIISDLRRVIGPLTIGVAALLLADMGLGTFGGLPSLVAAILEGMVAMIAYAAALAVFAPELWTRLTGRGRAPTAEA
ncbi:lipopolysaccharide biosynthesis protein [Jannaschia pagri]|uniref:Lipopolysaccharide biosynthesis protein n=1 Tax=Jannaschia pagri TaxID=2829797 RepID=A0ABQ4NN77_9RHOB|nr:MULTISPECIES: oligosaccharide flippase family protein [unclassified Jannaschia]GIT92012.1 lipopolysaccharide biosynthesis protein [Jannaschia sp. AI_61]GIT95846.1 lipopolysaccharide biosynthesis protein [Jannaschia sp. AI_62]